MFREVLCPKVTQLTNEESQDWNPSLPESSLCASATLSACCGSVFLFVCFLFQCHLEMQNGFPRSKPVSQEQGTPVSCIKYHRLSMNNRAGPYTCSGETCFKCTTRKTPFNFSSSWNYHYGIFLDVPADYGGSIIYLLPESNSYFFHFEHKVFKIDFFFVLLYNKS